MVPLGPLHQLSMEARQARRYSWLTGTPPDQVLGGLSASRLPTGLPNWGITKPADQSMNCRNSRNAAPPDSMKKVCCPCGTEPWSSSIATRKPIHIERKSGSTVWRFRRIQRSRCGDRSCWCISSGYATFKSGRRARDDMTARSVLQRAVSHHRRLDVTHGCVLSKP